MEANEIAKLILDYIRINMPEILNDENRAEYVTRAFLAGYKAAKGYMTIEPQTGSGLLKATT